MADKVKTNYQKLRARLIQNGTTIARFATERGYPLSTVYDAAKGARCGRKSQQILKELMELKQ